MDKQTFAIAIDGPVAAGKGTIAAKLAHDLSGLYLYTGAMYRAVALFCLENHISLSDPEKVAAVLPEVTIAFQGSEVFLNGTNVTEKIKQHDVANGASIIGMYSKVRESLVARQRQIAETAIKEGHIVVLEGRDVGTKVFPDSPFKVYLTATPETRAHRRLSQYLDGGREVSFEEVLAEIHERDKRDTGRIVDPLPTDPARLGYFIVDSSNLSEQETVDMIKEELKKRGLV
jgi:CMP/dCMP kinase